MSAMAAGEPGRHPGAPSRRRAATPLPGRRVLTAVPGQRDLPVQRAGRLRAPKPRTPAMVLVPSLQATAPERLRVPAPAPGRPRTPAPAPGRPRTQPPAPRPAAGGRVRPVVRRAHPQPTRASTRPRSRLTRRGRIVVSTLAVAVMLLVAVLAWVAGATRADAARSGAPASAVYRNLTSVIVQPGQSLWAIAAQAEPGADPRSVIQEIVDLNALGGTSIQPGQRLLVPRG